MKILCDVELPVRMLRVGDRVERNSKAEVVVGLSVLPGEALITVGDEDLVCIPARSLKVLLRYVDDNGVEHRICADGAPGRTSNWQCRASGGIWEDE